LGSPSHSPFSWVYLGGSKKLGRVMASTVYMNYRIIIDLWEASATRTSC
jgi:hypothetical protein